MNYSLKVPAEAKEEIKRAIAFMERHLRLLLPSAHTLREIMKIESDVAKLYYPTFAKVFRPELGFYSRNSHRTFRPADASDVLNALLNYGFSILYAEVAKQLNVLGLDCYVGFFITAIIYIELGAAIYDMIEPFRHIQLIEVFLKYRTA
jgi:CRISP-associated protein Cas1